jgi:hypothetical protein
MVIADETAMEIPWGSFIEKARKALPEISAVLIVDPEKNPDRSGADLMIRKPMDVNSAVKKIAEALGKRKQD